MTVQPTQPAPDAGALALPTMTGGSMPGLAVISEWLTAAQTAEQLVTPLISSSFVPDAFKPRVSANATVAEQQQAFETARANATSAVLLGLSLGLDPLTSLQQIYVVKGRPGMYAKLKVALAQARGHRVWDEEYSAESVTVAGQRKGSDDVVRITLTIADAKRAGWTSNDAYSKTPADMLWARAASRVVDRVAADVLMGIASIEDLDDAPDPAVAARVTIDDVRGTTPAKASPAAVEAPAAAEAAAETAGPEPIDERTWRAINAQFVTLGVTGPGQNERRLTAISNIVGHLVEKGRDLTAVQGDVVLSTLQGLDRSRLPQLLGDQREDDVRDAALAADVPGDIDPGDADPDGDADLVDDVPEPDPTQEGWR